MNSINERKPYIYRNKQINFKKMKKIFTTLAAAALFTSSAMAQYTPDGSVIAGTFSLKDITGTTTDLFTELAKGKHTIIDLSATWCGPCWSLHTGKMLDNYYDEHGPTGTKSKDALVYLVEVDLNTTTANLNGTDLNNSQGDWITGTTHPIVDIQTSAEKSSIVGKFVNGTYGIPAVFVVCADKKLYKIDLGTYNNATALRTFTTTKCGLYPNSVTATHALTFSYDLAPNPSTSSTNLELNLTNSSKVSYKVTNALGQVVANMDATQLASGSQSLNIATGNMPNGFYAVQLQVDNEVRTLKLQVAN